MDLLLNDKNVLVTAGTKGIGFGIAKTLFDSGANVFICSRDDNHVQSAIKAIDTSNTGRISGMSGDIGQLEFLKDLNTKSKAFFGRGSDILINNNGGPAVGDTFDFSEEDWALAINRNLMSAVRLCKLVVPDMKTKKWGRVINLTSTTAKEPDAGMVLSNVTRAGVASFSKTIARELGPYGITVNTILTGGCMTDRLRSLIKQDADNNNKTFEEVLKDVEKTIPVRYIPDPDEFSKIVLFLCSKDAGFFTGSCFTPDGGICKSVF
jgi:3-oxoacyl-[acyl-carrier protein] reductase